MTTPYDLSIGPFWHARKRLLSLGFGALTVSLAGLVAWRLQQGLPDTHVQLTVHPSDEPRRTRSPYLGAAGTVKLVDGRGISLSDADSQNDRWRDTPTTLPLSQVTGSELLQDQLGPVLRTWINSDFEGKNLGEIPRAPDVVLTLQPTLQRRLYQAVRCAVKKSDDCRELPTRLLNSDPSYLPGGSSPPRAAMAAGMLIHEDSGAVLAMTGAWTDCARDALTPRRQAHRMAVGRSSPTTRRPVLSSPMRAMRIGSAIHRWTTRHYNPATG